MTTRFDDLVSRLPTTPRWRASGTLLPGALNGHQLQFQTTSLNTAFDVYVNRAPAGRVVTDGFGAATVTVHLENGDSEILILDPVLSTAYRTFVTVRDMATFLASAAEMLELTDAEIASLNNALSLDTVDGNYINEVYGQRVRQGNTLGFALEAFRSTMITLRQSYRQLGGHRSGLLESVASLISSAPFVLPTAWRPMWFLGNNLLTADDFDRRTRLVAAQFQTAGVGLPTLNARSLTAIHAAHPANGTNNFPGPISQPPYPQQLTVTFAAGWDGGNVTINGVNAGGQAASEIFVSAPGSTARGAVYFASVSSITKSAAGATANTASIGTAESRFIKITGVGDYNTLSARTLQYLVTADRLVWGSATDTLPFVATLIPAITLSGTVTVAAASTAVVGAGTAFAHELVVGDTILIGSLYRVVASIQSDTALTLYVAHTTGATASAFSRANAHYTLTDQRRAAFLIGRNPGPYDTSDLNVLSFDIDGLGVITFRVTVGAAVTLATIVTDINAALNADVRYGATYNTFANQLAATVLRLRDPAAPILYGTSSRVEVVPTACVASLAILGTPRAFGRTTGGVIAAGATSVACTSTASLPDPRVETYVVRLGRGLRANNTGVNLVTPTGVEGSAILTGLTNQAQDINGFVRLAGMTTPGNNGLHQIIQNLGGGTVRLRHQDAATGGAFTAENVPAATWRLYTNGHLATVTDNNRGTNTLTLAAPGVLVDLPNGALVELAEEMPVDVRGYNGLGTLDVDVNRAFLPAGATGDSVTPTGSFAPDGWQPVNSPTLSRVEPGLFALDRLSAVVAGGVSPQLVRFIPRATRYRGWTLRAAAWVSQASAGAQNVRIDYSFDGASYTNGSNTSVPATAFDAANGHGPLSPVIVTQSFEVPFDAAGVWIRIVYTSTTNGDRLLISRDEVVALAAPGVAAAPVLTGGSLGDGTIPRDLQHQDWGKVLYIWPRSAPDAAMIAALGMPSPALPPEPTVDQRGLIDQITPMQLRVDRFNVAELGVSSVTNLVGCYTDTEWLTATLTNMVLIVTAPAQMSYVRPSRASIIEREQLTIFAPSNALTVNTANRDGPFTQAAGNNDVLFEEQVGVTQIDGLPVPASGSPLPWHWVSATQIHIDAGTFVPASTYSLTYEIRMRAETAELDLGAGFANYLWLVDFAAYIHRETDAVEGDRTEQLTLRDDFTARLSSPSTQDKTVAFIVRDTGISKATLTSRDWDFADTQTVRLNPAIFDADSVYTITYRALFPSLRRVPTVLIEWRSAAAPGGTSAATYATVLPGAPVNHTNRYHQLRVTLTTVEDQRDIKLFGLGLKGVHMYGSSPSAPGIYVPLP